MSNSLSHSAGEHDPADIGPRQRRVETVGVLAQRDAEMSAPRPARRGRQRKRLPRTGGASELRGHRIDLRRHCRPGCRLASTAAPGYSLTRTLRNSSMRTYRIASIPADGIGPEVIAAGLEALDALAARDGGFRLDVEHLDWGSERYRRDGRADAGGRARPAPRPRTPSCSAPSAPPTSPITSRCGACACRSARASTNTPTSAPPASCPASPARCATSGPATSTG